MNLRALGLRLLDTLLAFPSKPYAVEDKQSVTGFLFFYSLERALRVGDAASKTAKDGEVHVLFVGLTRYKFTRDRKGRLHLPKAIRDRIL